jgi:hypothetical protein
MNAPCGTGNVYVYTISLCQDSKGEESISGRGVVYHLTFNFLGISGFINSNSEDVSAISLIARERSRLALEEWITI